MSDDMEVQRVNRPSLQASKLQGKELTDFVGFTEVLGKKKQEVTYERLQRMMEDLNAQGEVLAKNHTVDALRKYKKLVKEFMDEAVNNGLELNQQRDFNHQGAFSTYKTVRAVDQKLTELTNEVLNKEKDHLAILQKIGEVQGLLVNIYT
ncbi:YaaR family protein [Priestia koreensis]|uniref:YaaR family protein n=1 Tax=Priestia koreensis TaxID=284581 RepID=UPI00333EE4AB